MQPQLCENKGFVTLISVLLIGAMGTLVVLSLLAMGIGNSKNGLLFYQSNQAKSYANACAEEALEQIRLLISYTGSGNLSFSNGVCSYSVSGTPLNKSITAIGTVGSVLRKVFITTSAVNPKIVISLWQEAGD